MLFLGVKKSLLKLFFKAIFLYDCFFRCREIADPQYGMMRGDLQDYSDIFTIYGGV